MNKVVCVLLVMIASLPGFSQDLVITTVTTPAYANRYESLKAIVTVKNQGIVAISQNSLVAMYLSTDNTLSQDDAIVGFANPDPLLPNQSQDASNSSAERVEVLAGTYYLIMKADDSNLIAETDETNNTYVIPGFVVSPADVDLSFKNLSVGAVVAQNDRLPLNYLIQETGSTAISGGIYVSFYLSTDDALDALDPGMSYFYLFLEERDTVRGLAWHSLTIPAVAPGQYYVIGKVDADYSGNSEFDESNENNNTFAVPVTITPPDIDFDFSQSLTIATLQSFGSTNSIVIDADLKNTGTTGVLGYHADIYLSTDQQLDAGWHDKVCAKSSSGNRQRV